MAPEDGDRESDQCSDQSRRWGVTRRRLLQATGGLATLPGLASAAAASSHDNDHGTVLNLVPTGDATHRITSSGRWSDPSIWEGGRPSDGARVHVPADVTVTFDADPSARLHWLRVDGAFTVDTGQSTELLVDTFVTTDGSRLELGTASDPVPADVTATVTFLDRGPIDEGWDPTVVSRGLLAMGAVSIHGATTTGQSTLASHPTAGDGALELDGAPTNWQVGDALVVPGVSAQANQDEEVTVAGVDGSTVAIEETLQYDHVPPASDLDTYALHLDRSVRLRSENTAVDRRGHVMVMSPGSTIRHAGLYDLGRTDKREKFTDPEYGGWAFDPDPNANRKARYALHYHKTGPFRDLDPHEATGCVVAPRTDGSGWKGSPGWGFTNHRSYAHVQDCLTYKVIGTGFMTETGVEIGTFHDNFALRSSGSGDGIDWREFEEFNNPDRNIDDFGHGGHGFWLHGPLVSVERNVAAGHRHQAFAYWTRALGDYVPDALPYDDPRTQDDPTDRMNESELGRHRGEIPNVPASYADGKPSPEHNVAPGTGGPNVAEFAFSTFERADGTTLVDEGSIPIRNVDNTAFASGAGIDVMNHMRGVDERVDDPAIRGNEAYYGKILNFTGWNLNGKRGRNIFPASVGEGVAFYGAKGVNVGISFRYASWVKVENARLIGDGEGVGIHHNQRMSGLVVEDSTIEGFDDGIAALRPGRTDVRNCSFDTNNSAIYVRGGKAFAGDPQLHVENIDAAAGDLWLDPNVRNSLTYDDWDLELTVDGAPVYFDEQAPDHVLVPDQATYDDLGGTATFDRYAEDIVGKTVQQLSDQYGIAPFGEVAPASASSDPLVDGGIVGGDGSTDTAPTVSLTSAPDTATVGESVTFEASGSDADGGSVTYDWTSAAGSGTGSSFTTAFDSVGDETVTVTVTDDEGQTATASTVVSVSDGDSGDSGGSVEAAINCGDGAAHTTSEGVTYAADAYYTGGGTDAADRDIANTDEDGLYDSNRWGNETVYDVPVSDASATYDVTLHFAETYFSSSGARVFDVLVEGTTELSGFDPYAAAGGKNTAVSRTITGVAPTDGSVTISFSGVTDNALVSGIEIAASSESAETAPTASITSAPSSATVGESMTFEASGPDADGGSVTFDWSSSAGSGTGTSYTTSFDAAGEETVTVTVTDDEGQTATASTVVTVEQASGGSVAAAINCGGSAFTAGDGTQFAADANFSGGATYSVSAAIANTDDDALYQHARQGSFQYTIPVESGTYAVRLHFAELYFDSVGARVFDVVAEGATVLDDYDIVAAAGDGLAATTETVTVDVTDGELTLDIVPVQDQAQLAAVEVVSQ